MSNPQNKCQYFKITTYEFSFFRLPIFKDTQAGVVCFVFVRKYYFVKKSMFYTYIILPNIILTFLVIEVVMTFLGLVIS